jgi:polyisoprenyl-teichoic acid--peptidoglycan teichoic acid transferase
MSRAKPVLFSAWQKALAVWRRPHGRAGADTETSTGAADSEQVPAAGDRAPAIAAGLSFLWPGLGHLFLGRRRQAAILALPALLLAILAIIELSQGALMFAASLWDESYFLAVAGAVIVFGAWRIVAVGHAFLSTSRHPRSRPRQMAFVAALVVVIVATHGLFVAGTWAWYETSVTIQNNDLLGLGTPAPSAATPLPTLSAGSTLQPTTEPTAQPSSTRAPNPNRITFLLVGVDWMPGRDHSLTDTMMLASLDTATGKAAMVSIPRDTANFDLYYGGKVGVSFKLNTLMNAAMRSDFGSPDTPIKTLENEIGYLVGVHVDYYALISLAGLAGMIDTLGGIDVYNARAINDNTNKIYIPAGNIHLNGATAIGYVRSREGGGDSDYTRAARQQAVLMAAKSKLISSTGLSRIGSLLTEAGKDIATDFPLKTARDYVTAVQHVSLVEGCVLGSPYSVHPDMSLSGGTWTTVLDMGRVANLSVQLFGEDSRFYGQPGVTPAACGK